MVNSIIPSSPSQDSPINTGHFQTDASTKQMHQLRNEEEGRGRKRKGEKERERRTKLWFAS